jgi:hypothetical protein
MYFTLCQYLSSLACYHQMIPYRTCRSLLMRTSINEIVHIYDGPGLSLRSRRVGRVDSSRSGSHFVPMQRQGASKRFSRQKVIRSVISSLRPPGEMASRLTTMCYSSTGNQEIAGSTPAVVNLFFFFFFCILFPLTITNLRIVMIFYPLLSLY